MVHEGKRLPFSFESGDHLPRVHAQLDDLQGYFPSDRFLLFGHVDAPEASLADLFEESVPAYTGAGGFDWEA